MSQPPTLTTSLNADGGITISSDTMSLTLQDEKRPGARQCGGCTLCCKLTPVRELKKKGGERCQHQRHGKGCAIYAKRPGSCALWACRWLVNDDTADMRRPDRSHYVIDIMPDFITMLVNATGEKNDIPVLQVWVDPLYPDAHRDPALRAYIERHNMPAIIRYDEMKGFVLFPPSRSSDRQWHEVQSDVRVHSHRADEVFNVMRRFAAGENAA